MIVGVTGSYCAGKDTAAQHLEKRGFTHISLSDILRSELRTRQQEITRDNLIAVGNELRETYGHGALAFMAWETLEPDRKYVVSSIRHPAEVKVLDRRGNFVMSYIDAPAELRYQRMQERNRAGDNMKTLEEFLASEQREQSSNPAGQQLHKMKDLAKVIIENTGTPEEFTKKLEDFLNEWQPQLYKRPTLDEYFINLARVVGSRGTCDRGKAGSVIVRNKHVLSTGYVGAPAGIAHCDEVEHEMQGVLNTDGSTSQHCVRTTHAEQNAIAQAARNGTAIEGSTLYCKMEPCYVCAKMIINAGIKRVVCEKRYHRSQRSREIFKEAGIELKVVHDEFEKYANQK